MSITLNSELAKAIDQQGNLPLPTVHPTTGEVFFLVSAEQYNRLQALFEEVPRSIDEQRFQVREMGRRAGWDDPSMDAYDRYDDHAQKGRA
jgi:hypothetical protein